MDSRGGAEERKDKGHFTPRRQGAKDLLNAAGEKSPIKTDVCETV
jgi:hypothetical protein